MWFRRGLFGASPPLRSGARLSVGVVVGFAIEALCCPTSDLRRAQTPRGISSGSRCVCWCSLNGAPAESLLLESFCFSGSRSWLSRPLGRGWGKAESSIFNIKSVHYDTKKMSSRFFLSHN